MPVFVQVYPATVILTLSEAEGEESLYFARSTVDTTGKIQGSVSSAQDDGHSNDYSMAYNLFTAAETLVVAALSAAEESQVSSSNPVYV